MESKQTYTNDSQDIIDDVTLRDQLVSRLEVLDKVKRLFLISYNEMATIGQVADYFNVPPNVLRQCILRNREELDTDGISVVTSREFRQLHNVTPKQSFRGHAIYSDVNDNEFELSSGKTMFLPKRAVLRIGMLLRDSKIAQEVRTQLLNTFEQTNEKQKTSSMNEEEDLIVKMALAKSPVERAIAISEYRAYKDRHATALQGAIDNLTAEKDILNVENDALARKELDWQPRAIVEKLIRTYAAKGFRNCPFSYAASLSWQRFYDELYYEYRISLASRRKRSKLSHSPALDFVREEEWPVLVAKAFAMCRRLGCDVVAIIGNDVVMERIEQSVREAAQFVPQPEAAMAGN